MRSTFGHLTDEHKDRKTYYPNNITSTDSNSNSTLTLTLTSKPRKMSLSSMPCHIWFTLFFLICFTTPTVLSIPLDRTDMEESSSPTASFGGNQNPRSTETTGTGGEQNPNQLVGDGKLSRLYLQIYSSPLNPRFLSSVLDADADTDTDVMMEERPNQKMTPLNLYPSNSFIDHNDFERERRNSGPSLSIVNPLDVLRQRLLLEIGRRRLHSQSQQINANTEFLRTIGKRRRR